MIYLKLLTVALMATSLDNKRSAKSSLSIFAPSESAFEGSGWVSMNMPSTPTAMPAFAIVSII